MVLHTPEKLLEKLHYIDNSWATVTLLKNVVKVEAPYF